MKNIERTGMRVTAMKYLCILFTLATLSACAPDTDLGLPTIQQSPGIQDTIQEKFVANGGWYSLTATPTKATVSVDLPRLGAKRYVKFDTVIASTSIYDRLSSNIVYSTFAGIPSNYEHPDDDGDVVEGTYSFFMRSGTETHSVRSAKLPPPDLEDLSFETWDILVEVSNAR